jgi:hypothetical protein
MKRARKARGYKKTGERSQNMCTGCFSFHCDPMMDSPLWALKKHKRHSKGQCVACGKKPCKCKSTLSLPLRKSEDEIKSKENEKIQRSCFHQRGK